MRTNLRAVFLCLVAMTASMLATNVRQAMAQSTTDNDVYLVKASRMVKFSRYYAPYAIQAAAAYLPVREFDDRKFKTDERGYGDDAKYAVQSIFGGDVEPARKAIQSWQYQFGNDSYLTCFDPADTECQRALRNKGWDFGSGPAFQVWARTRVPHAGRDACSEVSIAFRGTVGLNSGDWFSNANRFGSPYDDYYYQLRRNIDGIITTIKRLPCYRLATQIVSTGHSLGGGLAQLAALANKPTGPRITKVFAFDPSPVTGAHVVEKQRLKANAEGLTIDRIYQEGEALSYARDFVQQFPPNASVCKPFVRTVKVDAVSGGGVIGLHAMNPLAVQMVGLSYDGDTPLAYRTPPSPKNCSLDYRPPATDEDTAVVASAGARRARQVSVNNYAGYADQLGASYPLAEQQGNPATKLTGGKLHRVAMSGGRRSKKLRVANAL
jgi:pimeloyl-ACP methyl ester carboxylesterase